jgi:uncharacterized protein YkwD
MLTWTKARPTKSGWYWLKRPDDRQELRRFAKGQPKPGDFDRSLFAGPFVTAGDAERAARPDPPPPRPVPPPTPKPGPPPVNPDPPVHGVVAMFDLHNAARAAAGLPPLASDGRLAQAAAIQVRQMAAANRMAHDLPGAAHPTLLSRIRAAGYECSRAGENIAAGFPTPEPLSYAWLNSPGHRANILGQYAHVGLAREGPWWCAVFGSPPGWRPSMQAAPAGGDIGTAFVLEF